MMIDLSAEAVVTIVLALGGTIGTIYGRSIAAENQALKTELGSMKDQHTKDIARIDSGHDDIWNEIKDQRESLSQNREAVIRLNSSIERLNEILPKLEAAVSDKMSVKQCELVRQNYVDKRIHRNIPIPGGRRAQDPPAEDFSNNTLEVIHGD